MSSKPILISVIEDKPIAKYYVYYDEWTGDIRDITNRKKEKSDNPYILTEDSTAGDLLLGLINPKKFAVARTETGKVLMPKDHAIRIKQAETELSLIPKVLPSTDSDINIVLYINDWLMEVNINQDTVYKLTGSRYDKKYIKSDDSEQINIELFLIAENNPFYIYDKIEIDTYELFNKGYQLFNLQHLQRNCAIGELDILTKRIFKTYGVKIKQNYVTVDYHTNKSHKRTSTMIYDKRKTSWTTFTVVEKNDGWIIKSNFDDPNEQKIYGDLFIYLVGDNPHELYDRIRIPLSEIGGFKEYTVDTAVSPKKCRLLLSENGYNINFNLEETQNV
jgi:hypothetical protein